MGREIDSKIDVKEARTRIDVVLPVEGIVLKPIFKRNTE